jgi:hypothetical protein
MLAGSAEDEDAAINAPDGGLRLLPLYESRLPSSPAPGRGKSSKSLKTALASQLLV